jgi:hypothetical protein
VSKFCSLTACFGSYLEPSSGHSRCSWLLYSVTVVIYPKSGLPIGNIDSVFLKSSFENVATILSLKFEHLYYLIVLYCDI